MATKRGAEEEGGSRAKREAYGGGGGGSDSGVGTTGGAITDGYGTKIFPMYARNIFNQMGYTIPWTLKRSHFVDLDYTATVNPIILHYQALEFWVPIPDQRNWKIFCDIGRSCRGFELHRGKIFVEVWSITRQRLLQGGTTNYNTFDFETSQNLIISRADRRFLNWQYPADSPGVTNVIKPRMASIRLDFDKTFDERIDYAFTREELPQRHLKVIDVNFPPLRHNYIWDQTNLIEGKTVRRPIETKGEIGKRVPYDSHADTRSDRSAL